MAESLLFSIAEGVLGKIASLVLQQASAIYSVEDQISELKNTLTAIMAVLSDAEEQKTKNRSLQAWLGRLQDVLYDAENVIDELECEALRKQVISQYGGAKEKVHRFFSLSNPLILRAKISQKIKEVRETLSKISIEKNEFNLNVRSVDGGVMHMRSREMTYSFVSESNVVGRDIDKQRIIEILMQSDNKNLSVIPIVGIGGLGKTTLAKLVYNDDSVKEHFDLRLWVCVPEDFDLKRTIEGIVKEATHESLSHFDIQQLQTSLQGTIKDKKYLLVLDDVWSIDRNRWTDLRDLLSKGASGSKIIVTTRNSEVASIMGTCPEYNLKGLSHEDSMALFEKWAFDKKEKQALPDLLEIGNEIVKKSQGVPLLVKTMGSLLHTKEEKRYWAHIRDSETWKLVETDKNIMPVLKLSYDHLPSHLKRCFATISLFPRGYEIVSDNLIRLWMALGLISSTRENSTMEDVGVEYIKDLSKRSLLHAVEESELRSFFTVHDLIHSMATIVAQNYCSIVGLDNVKISERVRYVSLSSNLLTEISNSNGVPPFLRKPTSKKLRAIRHGTLKLGVDKGVITKKFVTICISMCNHLRYLDLSYGIFEELPHSICNLKQLRSLCLRENKRLKKLPDTICELQSLLQLSLHGCSKLVHLPKYMKRLVRLRFLSITTKQKSMQESGIEFLGELYFLGIYKCADLQVLFEGTRQMTCLRELEIGNCGRPIYLPFGNLIALESLMIDNCELTLTPENKSNCQLNLVKLVISRSQQVMELLQYLSISTSTLECFSIYDCSDLTAIPESLFDCRRLRSIRLIRCRKLWSMPEGIQSLTALRDLHIQYCGELSHRCEPVVGEDWHKIAHVPQIQFNSKHVQRTGD